LKGGTSIGRDLSLSDHVGDLDPCNGGLRGVEGFEAHHWGGYALDEAMILLEEIVEVLDLQDLNLLARAGELEDKNSPPAGQPDWLRSCQLPPGPEPRGWR